MSKSSNKTYPVLHEQIIIDIISNFQLNFSQIMTSSFSFDDLKLHICDCQKLQTITFLLLLVIITILPHYHYGFVTVSRDICIGAKRHYYNVQSTNLWKKRRHLRHVAFIIHSMSSVDWEEKQTKTTKNIGSGAMNMKVNMNIQDKKKVKKKAKIKNNKVNAKKSKNSKGKRTTSKTAHKTVNNINTKDIKKKTKRKVKAKGTTKNSEPIYFWSDSNDNCIVEELVPIYQVKDYDDEMTIQLDSLSLSMQNGTAELTKQNILSSPSSSSYKTIDKSTTFTTNTFYDIETEHTKKIHFTIRGNPLPLQRHRTYRNFVYNPSAQKQKQFYQTVLSILPTLCFTNNANNNNQTIHHVSSSLSSVFDQHQRQHGEDVIVSSSSILKLNNSATEALIQGNQADIFNNDVLVESIQPFFKEDEFLHIKILFHLKRPKNHFLSNKPGPGRLRSQYSCNNRVSTRVDVDNLAKFVLDSLNGILYVDDRQIVELHVKKVFDNEDECLGKTQVWITRLDE